MSIIDFKHQISAYTIEAAGTPVATIKAASILDAMRFVSNDFEQLTGDGHWDGEEPLAIRNANWIEKDALLIELRNEERSDVDDEHFVYWHSREFTSCEKTAHEAGRRKN